MSFDILTESSSPLLTESGNNLVTAYETPPTPNPCSPENLIAGAQCIDSCIPQGMQTAILISIFCNMASLTCTAEELINGAACIDSCVPPGMRESVLIYLACQISNGGGSGILGKELFSGNGDPTGVITPTVTDALYRQLDSEPPGLFWTWTGAGPWVAPTT